MKLSFPPDVHKEIVFETIEKKLLDQAFRIVNKDTNRPWGGFFVIDEQQSELFLQTFFPTHTIDLRNKLSPKILIVAPGKRLSWQYHFRRAELWKVIGEKVGVAKSETNNETEMKIYDLGSTIELGKKERHRLIGLNTWGVVAEIWQHTDKDQPSNEEDIIRLQDDFGR